MLKKPSKLHFNQQNLNLSLQSGLSPVSTGLLKEIHAEKGLSKWYNCFILYCFDSAQDINRRLLETITKDARICIWNLVFVMDHISLRQESSGSRLPKRHEEKVCHQGPFRWKWPARSPSWLPSSWICGRILTSVHFLHPFYLATHLAVWNAVWAGTAVSTKAALCHKDNRIFGYRSIYWNGFSCSPTASILSPPTYVDI